MTYTKPLLAGALTMLFAGCLHASAATSAPLPGCPGTKTFTQKAEVFGAVTLCATADVPQAKLTHAANVTAEWLDNDGDGAADEARLIETLKAQHPVLLMSESGFSDSQWRDMEDDLGAIVGQDLQANETNPAGGRRDASQEEIHHLILNAGWAPMLPQVFRDQPGSVLYGEWQQAEAQGNYAYDDPTCDAACKVTEFFYLATAAYLGSDADLFSDEMRLMSRDALRTALPRTVEVMEATDYRYPTDHWPTGRYAHSQNIRMSGN